MRNREVIEKEMYVAREHLEANLAELKHTVAEKIDVKAQARVAIEKGKLAVHDALDRGADATAEALVRGKNAAADALDRGKTAVVDAFDRSKTATVDFAVKGKDKAVDVYDAAKERPLLVGAIVGGVIAVGVLAYVGRRNDWW